MYENVLGHDTKAMADPNYQEWMRRGVIWVANSNFEMSRQTDGRDSSRTA